MRWIENKSFQHPVLIESVAPDQRDYVAKSFQVTSEFTLDERKRPVLGLHFTLSEPSLGLLVKSGKAKYAAEVYCPSTFLRRLVTCVEPLLSCKFNKGELHEKVEISTYVVCDKAIRGHSSDNLHPEFGKNASFDLREGDVLAVGLPQVFWWDLDFRKPITSIFVLAGNDNCTEGVFELDFEAEMVQIMMHPNDKEKFNAMRRQIMFKPFLLASVYLNALAEALRFMSLDEGTSYEDRKWYRAIQNKLEAKELDLKSMTSFSVGAQLLLNMPLEKILHANKELSWLKD